MAHLVTGYAGKEHITSADQGSFNASFFGTGQFVMEAGQQFSASIVDNNTVRVLDGDMLMQGRHIRIPPDTYEDMTITTGTAGKNRIDLVCMTYEKDTSDGTEKAYLEVVKGTETEGTPQPPPYVTGNILEGTDRNQMPLYRVAVYGVVLSEIECLFRTVTTYQAMAEKYEAEFMEACRNFLGALAVFDTMEGINGNTEKQQLAGALALKEFYREYSSLIGTGDISMIGGGTVLGAILALSKMMKGATPNTAGTAGLVPAPPAGSQSGKYLRGDGTWQTPPDTNTAYSNMQGSSQNAAGRAGLVPAPTAGAANRYLRNDGTWAVPPDNNTVYSHPTNPGNRHIPAGGSSGQILRWSADGTAAWGTDNNTTYGPATQLANGLMSAADKKKLDEIAAGANKTTVDSTLSATSTNPVQNKAVKAELDKKVTGAGLTFSVVNGILTVTY